MTLRSRPVCLCPKSFASRKNEPSLVANLSSTIPEARGHWLLGNIPAVRRDFFLWLRDNQAALGDLYHVKLGPRRFIIVSKPEYVQRVLQSNYRNYRKSGGYETLKLFLGQGLLTSEGEHWRRQRRLAQPAFHREKLQRLCEVMTDEARRVGESWATVCDAGGTVDVVQEMLSATMNIVAKAMFGADVSDDIEAVSSNLELLGHFGVRRIRSAFKPPIWLPTPMQRRFKRAAASINDVLFRIISERRARDESDWPHDLLSMLMRAADEETGERMSDAQLRDEIVTIFTAGHETTALSMAWTWDLLGRHPDVAEKLKAEVESVLGDRDPGFEDVMNLPYTRMVIDEALRLYPPGWLMGRAPISADQIGPYELRPGTDVLIFTYGVHRHPELWESPNDFRPQRWETDRVKTLPDYAYFPFGGGPRICIGNNFALTEMTILLAHLARRFRLSPMTDKEPEVSALVTLRPKGELRMQIRSS